MHSVSGCIQLHMLRVPGASRLLDRLWQSPQSFPDYIFFSDKTSINFMAADVGPIFAHVSKLDDFSNRKDMTPNDLETNPHVFVSSAGD